MIKLLEQELMGLRLNIEKKKHLTKEVLLDLARWKTPRTMRMVEKNPEEYVEEVTGFALTTPCERARIERLNLLHGVSWATASVVLHFFRRELYPILDFRALWSVSFKEPNSYDFQFWWDYVEFCRQISREAGVDMRSLDRAGRLFPLTPILERFRIHLEEKDSSAATIKAYLGDVKKFLRWYQDTGEEEPDPGHIGPLDIAEFKRHLLKRGQKPATINRAIVALSAFFQWAEVPDPTENIKMVGQAKAAPRALDRKEQLALMRAARQSGTREAVTLTLLLYTGLRVSELVSLRMDDVHLKKKSGALTVRKGKGAKNRTVPLNSDARKAIKEWLEKRGEEPGMLFPGRHGGGLTSRSVEYMLERCSKRAGIEKVGPHVLRHTFCKSLIDAGESLDRVALLAGHENLNTTARYTRASNADLEKSVQRLAWE